MKKNIFILMLVSLFASVNCSFAMTDAEELSQKGVQTELLDLIENPADSLLFTGTNVGGTSWDRPFASDGSCCSGLGPVRLHAQVFHITEDDVCDISSVQNFDGYLLVYADSFNPLNQSNNFVAGNDDGNGGIGTSDIAGLALDGNRNYLLVTTGFAAGDEGDFSNTVSCAVAGVNAGGAAPQIVPIWNKFGLITFIIGLLLIGMFSLKRYKNN
jgi:hypothetical protein